MYFYGFSLNRIYSFYNNFDLKMSGKNRFSLEIMKKQISSEKRNKF